mmetsp:Transcript_3194/g.4245  ORF Transcript_3194/g.4245 Transcript_3194/m.4245 type:complete len:210 (+) Transcript_3194:154-783(+)
MRFFELLLATVATVASSTRFEKYPAAFAAIKPGDKLPSVDVHWGFPPQYIHMPEYCGSRNVIIVGLPGAFTPQSSSVQIPSYIKNQDALKEEGVEEVIFYCVHDGAVMGVWMHKLGLAGSMTQMFGDPSGEFTRELGMELNHPQLADIGIVNRCKRFAMYIENNIVKHVAISESDEDPAGDACLEATCAPAMIESIMKIKKKQMIEARD